MRLISLDARANHKSLLLRCLLTQILQSQRAVTVEFHAVAKVNTQRDPSKRYVTANARHILAKLTSELAKSNSKLQPKERKESVKSTAADGESGPQTPSLSSLLAAKHVARQLKVQYSYFF